MLNNRVMFDRHFNKNPKTKENPYLKIDALIWRFITTFMFIIHNLTSSIFFEKVPRYSNQVYAMSQHLIKQHEYL